jgi:hypothetical protein
VRTGGFYVRGSSSDAPRWPRSQSNIAAIISSPESPSVDAGDLLEPHQRRDDGRQVRRPSVKVPMA